MEKNIYKIEFAPQNIILICSLLLAVFLAWKLQVVIFMFFFAFILSSALRPLVDGLKRRGVPRMLSIFIIYLLAIVFIAFVIYISGAAFADQVKVLADNANEIITDTIVRAVETFPGLKSVLNISEDADIRQTIQREVTEFSNNNLSGLVNADRIGGASTTILSTINNIVGVLFGIFTVMIVSAYMVDKEEKFYDGILMLFPKKKDRENIKAIIEKVEKQLGSWLIGQFSLMIIVGVITYFGLAIPGWVFGATVISKYAVPLALIAGLLEAIPNIGPTVTWFIAIVITVGSNGSIVDVSYIAFLFTAIQQLEAIFIVPAVMKKAIGIDPIVTILGLIAAATLFGIVGAILVLPTIATFQIILEEVLALRKLNGNKKLQV